MSAKPMEFGWIEIVAIFMGAAGETGKHAAAAWRLRDQIKNQNQVFYDAKNQGIAALPGEDGKFPEVFILQVRPKDKQAIPAIVKAWTFREFTPGKMDVYEYVCERMGARDEYEKTVKEMGLADDSEDDAEPGTDAGAGADNDGVEQPAEVAQA